MIHGLNLFLGATPAANDCGTNNGFLPGIYDGLCKAGSGQVTITGVGDVAKVLGNAVRILLALGGGLAVIAVIAASIYYVTSTGDPKRIATAKNILYQSMIGLLLIISAYAIVTYIASKF